MSEKRAKDFKSLSNRAIFKFRDLMDLLWGLPMRATYEGYLWGLPPYMLPEQYGTPQGGPAPFCFWDGAGI
jgi:hypothetical protein